MIQRWFTEEESRKPKHRDRHKSIVIQGMGGSGKTQLALNYWGIFWIDASSRQNAYNNFGEIGKYFGKGDTFKAGLYWLSSKINQKWLLILDNADDPDATALDISDLIPPGNNGHVLITSRNPQLLHTEEYTTSGSLHLEALGEDEAIDLLLKCAYDDESLLADADARDLAQEITTKVLYRLAKTIDAAGRFIRQKKYTLEKYLKHYLPIQRKRERLSRDNGENTDKVLIAIQTTWETPLRDIKLKAKNSQEHEDAVALFHVFTFLHYDGVTQQVFENLWRSPACQSTITGSMPYILTSGHTETLELASRLETATQLLHSYGVLESCNFDSTTETTNRPCYTFHPLVQSSARHKLKTNNGRGDQRPQWLKRAIHVLASGISEQAEDIDAKYARRLIPHIRECIKLVEDIDESQHLCEDNSEQVELAAQLGSDSNFKARDHYGFDVQKLKHSLLFTHQGALQYERFALVYHTVAWWQISVNFYKRALLFRQLKQGSRHEQVLNNRRRMALDMFWNDELEDSVRNLIFILISRWRKRDSWADWLFSPLSPGHISYCTALSDLTEALWRVRKHFEAVRLGERAVSGLTERLGVDDARTATARLNLARVYNHVDKTEEAHGILVSVVRARKRRPSLVDGGTSQTSRHKLPPGFNNVDTLFARNELAFSLRKKPGRGLIVERISRNVSQQAVEILGEEHPWTLFSLSDLAKHLSIVRKPQSGQTETEHQEAVEIMEGIMPMARRALEAQRHHFFLIQGQLARVYAYNGKWKEAEATLVDLVKSTEPTELHWYGAAAALARVHYRAGSYQEAETLLKRLIRIRAPKKDSHTAKNPELLNVLDQTATLYKKTNQIEKLVALKTEYPMADETLEDGAMFENFNTQMSEVSNPFKTVYDIAMFLWIDRDKWWWEESLYQACKRAGQKYWTENNNPDQTDEDEAMFNKENRRRDPP
ncbi:hypothetical protein LTR51_006787 [Lithohypha guttulata]|nr:hypothetical protein LTR51_006787 [Lithohypha guttulata]